MRRVGALLALGPHQTGHLAVLKEPLKTTRSMPLSASRPRNLDRTLASEPVSVSSMPRAYFQPMARTVMAAACQSVGSSQYCTTVTSHNTQGGSREAPRTTRRRRPPPTDPGPISPDCLQERRPSHPHSTGPDFGFGTPESLCSAIRCGGEVGAAMIACGAALLLCGGGGGAGVVPAGGSAGDRGADGLIGSLPLCGVSARLPSVVGEVPCRGSAIAGSGFAMSVRVLVRCRCS